MPKKKKEEEKKRILLGASRRTPDMLGGSTFDSLRNR